MADAMPPQRPLPESLTRFLSDPASKTVVPPTRPLPRLPPPSRDPRASRPNRALPIFLAWALAYNVLGFAIIVLLWRSLG